MKNISRRQFLANSTGALAIFAGMGALLSGCGKKCAFQIGVCDWTLGCAGSDKAFDIAKSIGLDGVQLSSPKNKPEGDFFTPDDIAKFKAKMDETGLKVASTAPTCMNPCPFYSTDGAVEFTCKAIDAANALGAHSILLPFYGPANMQDANKKMDEKHFAPLVKRLKEVAPYAKKKDVLVCMENSISAEENIRVIEAVGSDYIKVYFDIFNSQYYGHNTLHELNVLGKKYIGEIHMKDKGHRLDSGSGMPESMQACIDAICGIGYEGWLVMELHEHNPKKDGSVEEVLKHNLEYLKKSRLFA